MTILLDGVALAPSVCVLLATETCLDLEDRLTGFRIHVEGCDSRAELVTLLEQVGLLAGRDSELARQRQHEFRQGMAKAENLERANALLRWVTDAVPFYRDRAEIYGCQVDDPRQWRRLPLLSRADVKRHLFDLCNDRFDVRSALASGRLELASTSGTTDERVQAFADSTLTRIFSSYPELWGVPNRADAPRTAVLSSPFCMAEHCTALGDMASRTVHEHTLFLPAPYDLFGIERAQVERIAAELACFCPAIWLVNPVYAHWLVRAAKQLGVELPRPDVIVSTYQYLSRIQHRALTRHFEVPVVNLYSATELGGCQVGLECGRGRLHVREDHCMVEVLGRDGAELHDGVGAVVITTLANEVTPLVRYALGDLAEWDHSACDCALHEWPAVRLHGRERDALYFEGIAVTTREFDDCVSAVPGIDFYSCRQVSARSLEVDVVTALSGGFDERALLAALDSMAPGVSVRVGRVERLAPAPSLKFPLTSGLPSRQAWDRQ